MSSVFLIVFFFTNISDVIMGLSIHSSTNKVDRNLNDINRFSSLNSNDFSSNGISILEAPFEDLCELMGGSGKASTIWKALRDGENPLHIPLLENDNMNQDNKCLSMKARDILTSVILGNNNQNNGNSDIHSNNFNLDELLIPCKVDNENVASCGTRKWMSTLYDGNQIESVLIPSGKFDRTTLCVSTQIGCDRGCAFCATGKMGLVRNLTPSEIVGQVIRGLHITKREGMPDLTNIVFMGMGDAGRNLESVSEAVRCITDRKRLAFAESKITVSTVGPSPEAFQLIGELPCTIAWSLHAADDALRKRLVPSTKYTIEELRSGLIDALSKRESLSKRTLMIAITLIDGVNDSEDDAERVSAFLRPILDVAPKIAVNLIPYNDINVDGLRRPHDERVQDFQQVMRRNGYFVAVRMTRGDDENAACGMLHTERQRQKQKPKQQ